MRKLETEVQRRRKEKKNQIILGAVLTFLLIMSTLGYSIMSNQSEKKLAVTENGVDFYRENNFWATNIGKDKFIFENLPSEISNVEIETNLTFGQYFSVPVYFVNMNQGTQEILNNIGKIALRYQEACLEEKECKGDLPIKNCDSNVFVFESGNKTIVKQKNNCVYILGDSIKGADAFLYKILGII